MTLPSAPIVNEVSPERLRAIIYGPPGAGKTTLTAGWFPKSNLVIDLEGGTRFLPGEHLVVRPKTYSEFAGVVHDLTQPGHAYTTVTIDTVDTLIRMADSEAGRRHGKVAAAIVEYGKGLADRDGTVMRDIGRLLATDLGVLLCAHPTTITLAEEGSEKKVERLHPRIDSSDRLRQPIMGLVDFVFLVRKHGDETRELVTGGSAAFETKRRVALPNTLPAEAGALYTAVKNGIDTIKESA